MMQKIWKSAETLAHGYSSKSTQWELSNEYQHDRVSMVFENLCVLVLWMKIVLALEGLKESANRTWICVNTSLFNITLLLLNPEISRQHLLSYCTLHSQEISACTFWPAKDHLAEFVIRTLHRAFLIFSDSFLHNQSTGHFNCLPTSLVWKQTASKQARAICPLFVNCDKPQIMLKNKTDITIDGKWQHSSAYKTEMGFQYEIILTFLKWYSIFIVYLTNWTF